MMLDALKAAILGVVEGITEFLPVSSTGHLIISGRLLSFNGANANTFDVAIQLGAILAVVVLYRSFFTDLLSPKKWKQTNLIAILLAIIPAIIVGFLCHSAIKTYLFSPFTVAIGLIAGGILLILVDTILKPTPTTTSIEAITPKQALVVGLMQCLSLWPGFSRSGATITGGIFAKINPETSALFSFIIAVPVMILAVGYDLYKSMHTITPHDTALMGIGFVVSFLVAMAAIVGFLSLLKKVGLVPFGIYRILIGSGILAFYLF